MGCYSLHDPIACKRSYNNTWGFLREEKRGERKKEGDREMRWGERGKREGEERMGSVVMSRGEKRREKLESLFPLPCPPLYLSHQREGGAR